MSNYYYLAASLPPLEFPSFPDISSVELKESLRLNLSKKDFKKVETLRLFVDINNIRPLLLEEEIDPRGNLTEKELDEALLVRDFLPEYVFDFLNKYDTLSEKLKHFSELISQFFISEVDTHKGFLNEFLTFEREWRLVVLALRSKITHRDVVKELQFEDYNDPIVAQILAQKDAEQYEPPAEYKDLKDRYLSCGPDPWQLNKMLSEYRFSKIQELIDGDIFSIDTILGYLAQLMIIEQWNELDERRGQAILDTFKTS
jgi:hypothetical protein